MKTKIFKCFEAKKAEHKDIGESRSNEKHKIRGHMCSNMPVFISNNNNKHKRSQVAT